MLSPPVKKTGACCFGFGLLSTRTQYHRAPVQNNRLRSLDLLGPTAFVCARKRANVELFHFEKRLSYACRSFLILAAKHVIQDRGSDLPRKPVLVFEPPALLGPWIRRKCLPKVIDFPLRFARHHERYRLVEGKLVLSGGIHGPKLLAEKREGGVSHRAFPVRFFALAVARKDIRARFPFDADARRCFLENFRVETDRVFRVAAYLVHKHEHGCNSLPHFAVAHEDHLPRQSILVFQPPVPLAPGVAP